MTTGTFSPPLGTEGSRIRAPDQERCFGDQRRLIRTETATWRIFTSARMAFTLEAGEEMSSFARDIRAPLASPPGSQD